jgi:hypothetical protein
MAWTTPITWAAGGLVTETNLNQQIRDNLLLLKTSVHTTSGKIIALSSSYLSNLSGANLTGVMRTVNGNSVSSGTHSFNSGNGRVVIPVGSDKWAT